LPKVGPGGVSCVGFERKLYKRDFGTKRLLKGTGLAGWMAELELFYR
jgi:hypothetical protein